MNVSGVSGRADGVCGSVKSEGADGSSRADGTAGRSSALEVSVVGGRGSEDDRDG